MKRDLRPDWISYVNLVFIPREKVLFWPFNNPISVKMSVHWPRSFLRFYIDFTQKRTWLISRARLHKTPVTVAGIRTCTRNLSELH